MKEIKNESIDQSIEEIKENNDQAADQVAEQPESLEICKDMEALEEKNEVYDSEPILINTDRIKQNQLFKFYQDLINNLNIHLGNLEYALIPITPQAENKYQSKEIPLDYVLGYLKAKDRKKFLRAKFIERNEIHIPGIANDKLIEMDILDIAPLDSEESALIEFDRLQQRYVMQHLDFAFPVSNLYLKATTDEGDNMFYFSDELQQAINQHCSTYARTEEQKELLDAVKIIADAFNYFISIGVSIGKIWSFVEFAIDEDRMNKNFTVNKNLFSSFLLREVTNIRDTKQLSGDFIDILT